MTYQPSADDFVNPERGWMKYRDLTNPSSFNQVRSAGSGLIYGRILADDFRNGPMSQAFLDDIQAGFDLARANGIKVKPRVTYNNSIAPDAPKAVILQHIQQLQPIWEANKDVIALMDAGFIGAWGEWHTSSNGLDNPTDRAEILAAILAALPTDRMVGIRTPHFKREIYSGSPVSDAVVITPETAFDGSDLSRVGHLNDCFLASPTDFGTYAYTQSGWPRSREIDYIGSESRFAPFGGETCALHPLGESANAMSEMERLHIDYLNRDYNQDVIQRWINDGSYDEISKRLGYRYELKTAELPNSVKPRGLLELRFRHRERRIWRIVQSSPSGGNADPQYDRRCRAGPAQPRPTFLDRRHQPSHRDFLGHSSFAGGRHVLGGIGHARSGAVVTIGRALFDPFRKCECVGSHDRHQSCSSQTLW